MCLPGYRVCSQHLAIVLHIFDCFVAAVFHCFGCFDLVCSGDFLDFSKSWFLDLACCAAQVVAMKNLGEHLNEVFADREKMHDVSWQ